MRVVVNIPGIVERLLTWWLEHFSRHDGGSSLNPNKHNFIFSALVDPGSVAA